MKAYMNKNLEESKSWEQKKATELSKVRLRKGSDFHATLPTIGHEHIFPDCNDPEFLLKCLNDYRMEWDDSLEAYDEIQQYTTHCTQINRVLMKPVAKTSKREFLDKKIWFRESDTGDTFEEGYNDIYLWITSAPDSFWPITKDIVRADGLIGITRFGKRRDGPGCYYQTISQTDCKINGMVMKVV